MHAARQLGIPTVTFLFSWDNLTSQGPIYPLYDHYLVWNEDIARQLRSIYRKSRTDSENRHRNAAIRFSLRSGLGLVKAKFCEETGADPNRPIVMYTTGMPNHMPAEEVLVESIADMLADFPRKPQLMVRIYAKDRTQRFEALKKRRSDILFPRPYGK